MQRSDERAGDEREAGEHASARPEPEHVARQQAFEANRRTVQRQQEQLGELAAAVAATQERLAASLGALAERAAREGRADDARRLTSKAQAAFRLAEHERREVQRWRQPSARERRRADAERKRQDDGGSGGAGSSPGPEA